tara:strand:- start:188 stop:517 length:330 start_codon:yes stop_codon:yes gene_type:complete
MIKLQIKPLSVNEAWKGRRYKTDKYKRYINDMTLLLPKVEFPKGKISIKITLGFSNVGSDIDNPLKPFLDILQKKYNFNDKEIYKLSVDKTIVKKGKEFISFEVEEIIV